MHDIPEEKMKHTLKSGRQMKLGIFFHNAGEVHKVQECGDIFPGTMDELAGTLTKKQSV